MPKEDNEITFRSALGSPPHPPTAGTPPPPPISFISSSGRCCAKHNTPKYFIISVGSLFRPSIIFGATPNEFNSLNQGSMLLGRLASLSAPNLNHKSFIPSGRKANALYSGVFNVFHGQDDPVVRSVTAKFILVICIESTAAGHISILSGMVFSPGRMRMNLPRSPGAYQNTAG